VKIGRRRFCLTVAAAPLTVTGACSKPPEPDPRTTLAVFLGLTGRGEASWLDVLSPPELGELQTLLTSPGRASKRSVDLVMKVISRRERLFEYVDYPPLDRVGICDGLIRE
jgi:hypothetical protein